MLVRVQQSFRDGDMVWRRHGQTMGIDPSDPGWAGPLEDGLVVPVEEDLEPDVPADVWRPSKTMNGVDVSDWVPMDVRVEGTTFDPLLAPPRPSSTFVPGQPELI